MTAEETTTTCRWWSAIRGPPTRIGLSFVASRWTCWRHER